MSREACNHAEFWKELQEYLELDPPCDVERVLGREHHVNRTPTETTCSFQMREFIDNSCELYEELSGTKTLLLKLYKFTNLEDSYRVYKLRTTRL